MIFGGNDVSESAVFCKDRKADFCARAGKLVQEMKDPAGATAVNSKYRERREALKFCGIDSATASAPACKVAVNGKDWSFVAEHCPAEGRAIALKNCTGMDFIAMSGSPYSAICYAYGKDLAKKNVADEKGKSDTATQPEQSDANENQSVDDKVTEGAKKLKKLLKF